MKPLWQPINVWMSSNEQPNDRFEKLIAAVEADERFKWIGASSSIPADVFFLTADMRSLNVELKTPADLYQSCQPATVDGVTSVHLADQIRSLSQRNADSMIWVLGTDKAVRDVLLECTFGRGLKGKEAEQALRTGWSLVASCIDMAEGAHIPVHFREVTPYKSLLQVAHSILNPPDLLRHHIKPVHAGLTGPAMLCCVPGVGPDRARAIIDHFGSIREMVVAIETAADFKESVKVLRQVPGVGPATATNILEAL